MAVYSVGTGNKIKEYSFNQKINAIDSNPYSDFFMVKLEDFTYKLIKLNPSWFQNEIIFEKRIPTGQLSYQLPHSEKEVFHSS
mgnify:CR=1 FL=1